jgi:hypothetical protein
MGYDMPENKDTEMQSGCRARDWQLRVSRQSLPAAVERGASHRRGRPGRREEARRAGGPWRIAWSAAAPE